MLLAGENPMRSIPMMATGRRGGEPKGNGKRIGDETMTPEERAHSIIRHVIERNGRDIDTITRAIREAVAEERERNCMAMCEFCRQPEKYHPAEFVSWGDYWQHRHIANNATTWCQAAAIRASRGETNTETT